VCGACFSDEVPDVAPQTIPHCRQHRILASREEQPMLIRGERVENVDRLIGQRNGMRKAVCSSASSSNAPACAGSRAGACRRRHRELRAGRSRRLARPSARSDADRHFGMRMGPSRRAGRSRRFVPGTSCGFRPARSTGMAPRPRRR
jgi:hypothetical protein